MNRLADRVAVVTGGASGIGAATARALVDAGAAVVIADVDAGAGTLLAGELEALGGRAFAVTTDTADESSVDAMATSVAGRYGRIDILVNGAAEFIMRTVDASVADWERVLAVNVVGYALCVKHVLPMLRASDAGAVVNISSISAAIAQPAYLTYNTTKGAVAAMTRCLALDLAPYGIRVNSVSPGTVWTRRTEQYVGQTMGLARAAADAHPDVGGRAMLRRCADPAEIAAAIVFLASPDASYITGTDLVVDGGQTAW